MTLIFELARIFSFSGCLPMSTVICYIVEKTEVTVNSWLGRTPSL